MKLFFIILLFFTTSIFSASENYTQNFSQFQAALVKQPPAINDAEKYLKAIEDDWQQDAAVFDTETLEEIVQPLEPATYNMSKSPIVFMEQFLKKQRNRLQEIKARTPALARAVSPRVFSRPQIVPVAQPPIVIQRASPSPVAPVALPTSLPAPSGAVVVIPVPIISMPQERGVQAPVVSSPQAQELAAGMAVADFVRLVRAVLVKQDEAGLMAQQGSFDKALNKLAEIDQDILMLMKSYAYDENNKGKIAEIEKEMKQENKEKEVENLLTYDRTNLENFLIWLRLNQTTKRYSIEFKAQQLLSNLQSHSFDEKTFSEQISILHKDFNEKFPVIAILIDFLRRVKESNPVVFKALLTPVDIREVLQ